MSATPTVTERPPVSSESIDDQTSTARVTGLWYLGLAVTGILGFLVIRPQILVAGDPTATLANLIDRPTLARMGLLVEMGIVVTQAVAAVWFFKLFRSIDHVAAWALAAFGLVNAAAILGSAASMATALVVAGDTSVAPAGDAAGTVALLFELSNGFWGVGAIFFGLWLIPMGTLAIASRRMPPWLGRVLLIGGFGYLLSAFLSYGLADPAGWLVDGLTIPATVGELWMIGYLLIRGMRPAAALTDWE